MSYQTMKEAIRARYIAKVLAVKEIPTQYDNQEEGDDFEKPESGLWVRCSILPALPEQKDICETPRIETPGIVQFSVFCPIGDGDKASTELADVIKNAFQLVTTTDGFTYTIPGISQGSRDGKWWKIDVRCPFTFDEQVSFGEQ